MYLEDFRAVLTKKWLSSLFRVRDVEKEHPRAKEYLHRLSKRGVVNRVGWGWYYIPKEYRDPWEFLAKDRRFKVVIKQTAASIWNYDFIHRDIYWLAVEDRSYKRALEGFARQIGWNFEIECYSKVPYEYVRVDGLFVEAPESCIVSCMSEWAFTDAFAILYFRKDEVDFEKLKRMARWRRISRTDIRVWTAVKYGCSLLNERLGKRVFRVRSTDLKHDDVRELVEEAVEKVIEFAQCHRHDETP